MAMLDFPGRTLSLMDTQKTELLESLGDVQIEKFEELMQSQTLQYWQSLLDQNTALIADFLSKNPKQRIAKLKKKHSAQEWELIHILACLAIRRSMALVELLSATYFPDHYRELTVASLQFEFDLRERMKSVDLRIYD